MKIKKSLLSVFLCISLMCGCLSPSISVYASSGETTESGSNFLKNYWEKSVNFVSGCITTTIDYTKDFIQHLTNHKSDYNIPDNTTPEEWIDDNVTVDSQGNVIYSNNVINSMRDCVNNYINNETGYKYCYSYPSSRYLQYFNEQTKWNAFLDLLTENQGNIVITARGTSSGDIWVIDVPCELVYVYNQYGKTYVQAFYNWQNDLTGHIHRYTYDSSISKYKEIEDNSTNSYFYVRLDETDLGFPTTNGVPVLVSLNTEQRIMYNSMDALRAGTSGVQEYYVSDAFNTSHTDNSITTTIGDINRQITYGDISTYVNNYHTTNNNYPTTNQVYNYINNYEGSDNPGGGGSSDDDDDDDASIWDLLKKVLDFISHIIDLIAGFLANLVDSLGDIVTSMINSIFDIFNAIKDDIPNAIGGLLEYLFPFLPSELLVLIRFSIVCSIIIGLIKLIRG